MEEKVILERMQGFVDLIEKNDLLNFYKDEEIPQIFEARNKNLENIVNTLSILDLLKGRSIIVNWILLFMVGTDFNAIISTFTNSKYYKSDEFQYSIKAIKLIESITKKYYHMKYDDLEIFARFLGDLKVSLDTLDIILPNATVSDSKAGQGFGGSKAKGEGLETYIRALNEQLAFMEKYLDPERLLYPKLAKSLLEIYNTIDKFSGRGFSLGKFNLSFKISRFNDAPQEIFLELQLQIKMLLDLLMSNNCGLDDTTKALILSASNNLSNNVENKNSDQCVEFLENILKLTKNLGKVISNHNEDLIFLQNGGAELTFDNLSTAKIIIYIKDLCEKLTEKQIE